jgi:hypothetical protein
VLRFLLGRWWKNRVDLLLLSHSSGALSSCLAKWIVSPLCQQRPLFGSPALKTVLRGDEVAFGHDQPERYDDSATIRLKGYARASLKMLQ